MTNPMIPDPQDHQMLIQHDEHHHEYATVPGRERCDFCSDGEIVWVYGADDATGVRIQVVGGPGLDAISTDAWGACKECKFFIDRAEVKKLADRSARMLIKKDPDKAKGIPLARLRRTLMEVQQSFWRNRRPDEDRPFERRQHRGHG